jgi:hypothetical protein
MVVKSKDISNKILNQVIELVLEGEQITHAQLKENLLKSEYIAYILEDGIVKTTATLKNPLDSYRKRVYRESKSNKSANDQRELGYIATHKDFEGEGYCSRLLEEFKFSFEDQSLFATTRKKSMIHILKKYDFKITGEAYKLDLNLMINHG